MDIGIELQDWRPNGPITGQTNRSFGAEMRPDWQALKARFAASYALRGAMLSQRGNAGQPCSFDSGVASALETLGQVLAPVNPTALSNSKPTECKDTAIAESLLIGGRGYP